MTTDTIAALATPFGPGAIAVLRLSGPQAGEVGAKALRKFQAAKAQANSVARDAVLDANGAVIDDVLVTWFQGPRSYTGEDVLEISAHGGVLVTRKILECLKLPARAPPLAPASEVDEPAEPAASDQEIDWDFDQRPLYDEPELS